MSSFSPNNSDLDRRLARANEIIEYVRTGLPDSYTQEVDGKPSIVADAVRAVNEARSLLVITPGEVAREKLPRGVRMCVEQIEQQIQRDSVRLIAEGFTSPLTGVSLDGWCAWCPDYETDPDDWAGVVGAQFAAAGFTVHLATRTRIDGHYTLGLRISDNPARHEAKTPAKKGARRV